MRRRSILFHGILCLFTGLSLNMTFAQPSPKSYVNLELPSDEEQVQAGRQIAISKMTDIENGLNAFLQGKKHEFYTTREDVIEDLASVFQQVFAIQASMPSSSVDSATREILLENAENIARALEDGRTTPEHIAGIIQPFGVDRVAKTLMQWQRDLPLFLEKNRDRLPFLRNLQTVRLSFELYYIQDVSLVTATGKHPKSIHIKLPLSLLRADRAYDLVTAELLQTFRPKRFYEFWR